MADTSATPSLNYLLRPLHDFELIRSVVGMIELPFTICFRKIIKNIRGGPQPTTHFMEPLENHSITCTNH